MIDLGLGASQYWSPTLDDEGFMVSILSILFMVSIVSAANQVAFLDHRDILETNNRWEELIYGMPLAGVRSGDFQVSSLTCGCSIDFA